MKVARATAVRVSGIFLFGTFTCCCLAWLALLSSTSCGPRGEGAGDGGPRWVRVDWLPLTERPSGDEIPVAQFGARDFDAAWRVEPGVGQVMLALTEDEEALSELLLEGAGARLASLPLDLVAADLHRATLLLDVPPGEKEMIRLAFLTGPRVRAYSELLTVEGGSGQERAELDLAQVRPLEGRFDSIVLETAGNAAACEVRSLQFTRTSLLQFLPTPHDGAGLVSVGDDGRLGVALDGEHPVEFELEAPAGAAFQMSYRVGPGASYGDAVLVLEGDGFAQERLPLGVAASEEWRVFRRTLTEALSGPVRVSLEGGGSTDGDVIALVADAGALVGRGETPPSTVLLITSDTHRGELIGMTSGGLVRTPALDALGARGLVFLDAAATSNATNPSHVALMTGMHPRDTHVVTNRDPLGQRAQTLAEYFASAGYRTAAAFSAFHLGDETSGLAQGFDRYDGPAAPTGGNFDAFAGAASATRDGSETVARALANLEDAEGAPLFFWVHVFDAHAPYKPKGAFDGRYLGRQKGADITGPGLPVPPEKVPRFLQGVTDPEVPWAQYRALVDYVDHLLTPLLQTPRVAAGIIAFTSDHGESFGEHGVWWNHAGVYPATTQVPLILAWPGSEARTIDVPVRQADLGKTILRLAGLEAPDFGGRDLRLALEPEPRTSPRFTLGYHARSASIDDGRWCLVLHLQEESNDEGTRTWRPGEVELFDRLTDPTCERDLVESRIETARSLRARLLQCLASGDVEGYRAEYRVKAGIDSVLAELGYSGGAELTGKWYDPDRGDAFLERFGDD
ncbi:Sulfatase [Planctomycetes bacterium Poly30]|uniref:Sulfatase n=1 Tax=Saltatorellus ferox TaxID=2528018 RepID=A0A518ERD5_9BACT|nr:Sulfatase [Planctomycetes bacterium Poly30]